MGKQIGRPVLRRTRTRTRRGFESMRVVVFQRPISGPQRISLSNAFELFSLALWPAVRIVGLARHILCCERTFTETGHV